MQARDGSLVAYSQLLLSAQCQLGLALSLQPVLLPVPVVALGCLPSFEPTCVLIHIPPLIIGK